jgi:hypothetical protein
MGWHSASSFLKVFHQPQASVGPVKTGPCLFTEPDTDMKCHMMSSSYRSSQVIHTSLISSWQTAQQHPGWQGFPLALPRPDCCVNELVRIFQRVLAAVQLSCAENVGTSTVLMMGLWGTHSLWTSASLCNLSTLKPHCFTRFRALTLLFLKIHILGDKMLSHWASGFWYFEKPQCLHLQDQEVPRPYSPSQHRQDVLQYNGNHSPISTAS